MNIDRKAFVEQLVLHEGFELKPYKCTADKLTIGVGRNLTDNGISEEEVLYLLDNDIRKHEEELVNAFPVVESLDHVRFYVLLDMAFNMGIPRLSKFKKMWAAISNDSYETAADEMLDSKWAKQVGKRSERLAEQMRTGRWSSIK